MNGFYNDSALHFRFRLSNARTRANAVWSNHFEVSFAATMLVVLFLALTSVCHGAPPQQQPPQFTRTIWRSQNGLPETIVQALAQDRDGYLWVGTTGGLARFDGARFSPLDDGTAKTLSVNSFLCLLLSRDGTLWAGTEGGGLLHIARNGTITAYAAPDGLSDAFVRSIYEDSSGRLWIGTDSGLFLKEGERLVRINQPGAKGALDVQAIAEDHEHNILAGGSHLIALAAGQDREIPLPGASSQNMIRSILEAKDGTLWIGTINGLLRQVRGKFQRVSGITSTVRSLLQADDGTIWIGTIGKGLWAYRDGKLKRIGDKDLLPIETVLNIFEDADHRIWVGTPSGLVRIEKTPVSITPLPRFGAEFGSISGASDGGVWMVAQEPFQVSGRVAIPLKFPGLPSKAIRDLYLAKDGSTWVGTEGRGVYHLTGGKGLHSYKILQHYIMGNFVRGFIESSRGEMWIATDSGLYYIAAKGVTRYGTADGLAHVSVRSLLEDREHDIWIGTDHGLSRWHDGKFVQDTATASLRGEKVWSVLQDRRGTMWFGTRDHGIFRFHYNTVEHYTTANGLMSNIVYQLLQDRTGRFWISSAETISSVPEEDMDGDRAPGNRHLSVTLYRMPYEKEGAQLSGGRHPAGYVAPDDTVWFPTNRGAAHVIAAQAGAEVTPVVSIVGIAQDGVSLPVKQGLQLPAGSTRLAFSFAPLFLGPQDGIRFRYKLEGFDSDWSPATSSYTATYTNLPAGTYRFRVRSFGLSQPDRFTEATLDFARKPFLYQTWWCRLLAILILVGFGLLVYSAHLRNVSRRFAIVLEERGRLAREMHDTVIQGCTGVSLLLEAIATQRENVSEDDDLLDVARGQLQSTIIEARQAVWDLRHNDQEDIDLHYSLAALAEQATQAFGIPVVCERIDPVSGISGAAGHELLMVTREAIANAGSHSNAESIRVFASLNGVELTLRVVDDGNGFVQKMSSDEAGGHFGIVGMRERMHRIGGTLAIHSKLGSGTEVLMKVCQATATTRISPRLEKSLR